MCRVWVGDGGRQPPPRAGPSLRFLFHSQREEERGLLQAHDGTEAQTLDSARSLSLFSFYLCLVGGGVGGEPGKVTWLVGVDVQTQTRVSLNPRLVPCVRRTLG